MTVDALATRFASFRRPFKLMVTGGGTGGHTYPALTAVREMQTVMHHHGASVDVLWVGTATGLESRVAPAEGIPFETVPTGKLRRSSNPLKMINAENMRDVGRVPKGVLEARTIARRFQADVILSTGGYVAVPVGFAARATKTPLVIHEQTVRLGLANRVLARSATAVALSSENSLSLLPDSVAAAAVVTGNPVRPTVLTGDPAKAVPALGMTGYDPDLPTVYITGGAQGSEQINGVIRENLPWLLSVANVIHQCGPNWVEGRCSADRRQGHRVRAAGRPGTSSVRPTAPGDDGGSGALNGQARRCAQAGRTPVERRAQSESLRQRQ